MAEPRSVMICQASLSEALPNNPQILLPSAVHLEERLTVRANQSLSQASSQSDKSTQFGFFVSGRRGPKQWGDHVPETKQWPNGNAAARSFFCRRFEPLSGDYGVAAAATVS